MIGGFLFQFRLLFVHVAAQFTVEQHKPYQHYTKRHQHEV